jgi:hypothetical protein
MTLRQVGFLKRWYAFLNGEKGGSLFADSACFHKSSAYLLCNMEVAKSHLSPEASKNQHASGRVARIPTYSELDKKGAVQ